MLKHWKVDGDKFRVSNGFALKGDLDVLKWDYYFDFATGKQRLTKNKKDEELSRTDYKVLHKQIEETKRHKISEFLEEFLMDQELAKTDDEWFFKNKIDIEGGDVYQRGQLLIFPLRSDFGGKVKGLYFLNRATSSGYSFSFDNLGVFLEGKVPSLNYYCYNLKDGYNAINLTRANTAIFFNEFDLLNHLKVKAVRDISDSFIVLGVSPSADELLKEKNTNPDDYYRMVRLSFNFALNVIVKFPPAYTKGKVAESFYEFYKKNPEKCDKILNEKDDNPNLTILGADEDSVWVWSKKVDRPKCIKANTKFSELLLLAPKKFWIDKYGTTQDKKITEYIFASASGKIFVGQNIRQAGLYKDGDSLVINTGKQVIGEPSNKYFYIKNGHYPEPKKKPAVDTAQFFTLMNMVFPNTSMNEKNEGYSIIAWSILSLFAQALPTRFSLHLYGDSSGGKNFTKDNIILPLQNKFRWVVKELIPGHSLGAFKYNLRSGISVLHFDETQDDNYDPKIQAIIRASSQGHNVVEQMKRGGHGVEITPTNFMSSSSFNYEPRNYEMADRNRVYGINYGLSRYDVSKRKETLMSLASLDLAEMGHDMFSVIYSNWNTFMKNYQDNTYGKFGEIVNGHKRNIYSQLLAFYQTLGIVPEEDLKTYKTFLKAKGSDDSGTRDFNKMMVDRIGMIPIKDNDNFKSRILKSVLSGVSFMKKFEYDGCKIDFIKEPSHKEFVKWVRHAYYGYSIKIFKDKKNQFWVSVLKDDPFIKKQLNLLGFPVHQASSYGSILKSEFNKETRVRYVGGQLRSATCIPLYIYLTEEVMDYWKKYDQHHGVEKIYR